MFSLLFLLPHVVCFLILTPYPSIHSLLHFCCFVFSSLPHWQDCHELWSKKRRRQRQSGVVVEEPPPSKVSRKETTSGTSAEPLKSSSPAPPQPATGKVEQPGAGDSVGQCCNVGLLHFCCLNLAHLGRFWRSCARSVHACVCLHVYLLVFVQWGLRKKIGVPHLWAEHNHVGCMWFTKTMVEHVPSWK